VKTRPPSEHKRTQQTRRGHGSEITGSRTTGPRSRGRGDAVDEGGEAQMFYCHARSEGRTCANGWWPENAFKKARDIGVTHDVHYPYTAGDQNCSGLATNWQADMAKVVSYQKLTSPADMKNWLATHGSITGCFVVYQDFFSYAAVSTATSAARPPAATASRSSATTTRRGAGSARTRGVRTGETPATSRSHTASARSRRGRARGASPT
jgi:hypothetical protein